MHYYLSDDKTLQTEKGVSSFELTPLHFAFAFKTAAIYSPTFTQYHRRGWA